MKFKKFLFVSLASLFIVLMSLHFFKIDMIPEVHALTTTISVRVNQGTDDALLKNAGTGAPAFSLIDASIDIGSYDTSNYEYGNGMNFRNVTVPAGATVTAAYLNITCRTTLSGVTVNSYITAENVVDGVGFTTLAAFQSRRANNISGLAWNSIPAWTKDVTYQSPDIATVVSSVVTNASWVSGSTITLFWDDYDNHTGKYNNRYREGYSFNSNSTSAPLLTITYTTDSPPTIGEFSAPSSTYAMQSFNLSMVASDLEGKADLKTLTVSLTFSSVDLIWTESTNVTSKTDASNTCDLVASYVSELNSTSYNITWTVKFYWNFTTSGTGGVIVYLDANTIVVDDPLLTGSTTVGQFTFYDGLYVKASPTWSDVDGRCNPSQSLILSGQLYYVATVTAPTNNSLITVYCSLNGTVKGSNSSISNTDATFQISINAEAAPIGNYAYNVYSLTDEPSTTNRTASIIVDTITITLTPVDSRINIGATAVMTNSSVYTSDGSLFVGTQTLNDTLTKTSVGKYAYNVSAMTDTAYGLTTFSTNAPTVTFDAVMLFLSIDDNRIDIGASAYANLNATYAYDETPITDGTITLNGTNMVYQSGSWWQVAVTQAVVGQYTYCVDSVTGNTYGITQLGIISLSLTGDRFTIPDSADFAFNAFTLAVWCKPTASAVDGYLISQWDAATKDGFFLWQCADRGDGTAAWVFEVIVNNVGDACFSDAPPVAGVWQHVLGVRDASGNMEMYIDGILQTNTTVVGGGIIDSTSSVYIGTLLAIPAADYNGYLCEHRFYNRALLEPEIYQLYQSRQTNNTGLVALYTRCSYDMANALWHDLSGNGHNGVIQTVTVIAGLSTDEVTRPVWDSLMIFNVQPPQYRGNGAFYYQAQIEWVWDSVLINGATCGVAYPNDTAIGSMTSNSTGWLTFIINQGNATNGVFIIYGIDDNCWDITVSGSNKTFTLYDWALNSKDISGSAVSNTNLGIAVGPITVWNGTERTLYVPGDTFDVSITWLQNLVVNTSSILVGGATSTDFNCTIFPLSGTSYHCASNQTITSTSFAGDVLSISFSGAASTYLLVVDRPVIPTYIVNVTYDIATVYTPYAYLVLPHYGNVSLVVSYEWGEIYVQSTNQILTSSTLTGYKLYITFTGTAGDSGILKFYCGTRGNPAATTGFVTTSYVGSTLTGNYVFASDVTVILDWTSYGSGGVTGGGASPLGSLIASISFGFPEATTQGTQLNGLLNITWTTYPSIFLFDVQCDSPYNWYVGSVNGLPLTLNMENGFGKLSLNIVLFIPNNASTGTFTIPFTVVLGSQESTKTIHTVVTLTVETPKFNIQIPNIFAYMTIPDMLIYAGLGSISLVIFGTVFRKRERNS